MFAISIRWATENAESNVNSNDETVFDRFWLLNSENSDMMSDSTEVVESMRSSMNMSLKCEVNEVDVNDDEMKMRRFSVI